MEAAAQGKLRRVFAPSATATAAAERAAAAAQREVLQAELVPADNAVLERARGEAYARTIQAYAPRWFVVPFAFSSLGCLASSTEEVMRAMAARYAASEAAGGGGSRRAWDPAREVAAAAVGGYRARGVGAAAAGFAGGARRGRGMGMGWC